MAGTIIDSLVIELGLDAAKMSKGAQKSVSELRRMENTAEQTGKRVSESGTRAAEFFTKMSAAALGFFGVITAGRGLKAFISDTVSSTAALGRFAHNVGVSAGRLSAWQGVAEATGASANDVNGAMSSLASQFQTVEGRQNLGLVFGQMGAHLAVARNGLIDVDKTMLNLADTMSHMDPQRAQTFGGMLGISPDMVNVLERGSGQLQKMLAMRRRFAPSDRDVRAMQQLQEDWSLLTYQGAAFGRTLLTAVEPELHSVLLFFTKLLQDKGPEGVATIAKHFDEWGEALKKINWDDAEKRAGAFLDRVGHDAEVVLRLLDRVAALSGASRDGNGGSNERWKLPDFIITPEWGSSRTQGNLSAGTGGVFGRSFQKQDEDALNNPQEMQKRQAWLRQLEQHYGLDAGILDAVWAQESGRGRNTGPSSAGALGDYQIMPKNFLAAGINPRDFYASSQWSARELATNKHRFGDVESALGSFNDGAGNVDKAKKQWGADWLSHLPKETREYVPQVIARMHGASSLDLAMHKYVNSLNPAVQQAIASGGQTRTGNNTTNIHIPAINITTPRRQRRGP